MGDPGPQGPTGVPGSSGPSGDVGAQGQRPRRGRFLPVLHAVLAYLIEHLRAWQDRKAQRARRGCPVRWAPSRPPGLRAPQAPEARPGRRCVARGSRFPAPPRISDSALSAPLPQGDVGPAGPAGPEGYPPARIASTVVNPINGDGVAGAQVQVLRRGVVVGSVVADERGDFSVDSPPGLVQIVANASGFLRFSRYTLLLPRLSLNEKLFLPPVMRAGSISFVLTWDKAVPDMDLHIMTPWGCQAGWTNKLCQSGSYQAPAPPAAVRVSGCPVPAEPPLYSSSAVDAWVMFVGAQSCAAALCSDTPVPR